MAVARKIPLVNDGGSIPLPSFTFPGMPLGFIVTDSTGVSWQLALSTATVDHTSVEACAGNPQLRWTLFTSGGGGTITTSAPLSGNGSVGTPATIANGAVGLSVLATQAATTLVGNSTGGVASPTALTVAQALAMLLPGGFARLALGAALTDASVTVNPGKTVGMYVMPAATMTAARTVTLGLTGAPITGQILVIRVLDVGGFALTIKDDAATTLYTTTVSQAADYYLYYNGAHFTANTIYPIQTS